MPDRIAYLLLAHAAPAQLGALVRELAGERAAFYVHVDRAARASVFREMQRALEGIPNVRYVERQSTPWGSFALVEATLRCMQAAEDESLGYSHAVLLSERDFPIRPRAEIEAFLAAHADSTFMEWHDMPFWLDSHHRLRHWHLRRRHLHIWIPARRRIPAVVDPIRGGAMWWCMARDDVRHCLDMAARHPEIARYFRHTDVPDETFFQTLVCARPGATVVNDSMRFILWDPDAAHPETLTAAHLDAMTASGKLFARKFDETANPGVLDLVRARTLSAPAGG